MAGETLTLSAKQLATMMERTKARERARIADELRGYAVLEDGMNHPEAAESLRSIADGLAGAGATEPVKPKLSPEQIAAEGARLLVPGLERLPFAGYDAGLDSDDAMPAIRERSDADDISNIARRL